MKLIDYGSIINTAVQRMILAGQATETTLVFETAQYSGLPCSSGATCVFAPDGGGVQWQPRTIPKVQALPAPYDKDYYFYPVSTQMNVLGVGTTLDDVAMIILDIPKDVCASINRHAGLPAPDALPSDMNNLDPMNTPTYPNDISGVPGAYFGCIKDGPAGDLWHFFYVFVAR